MRKRKREMKNKMCHIIDLFSDIKCQKKNKKKMKFYNFIFIFFSFYFLFHIVNEKSKEILSHFSN